MRPTEYCTREKQLKLTEELVLSPFSSPWPPESGPCGNSPFPRLCSVPLGPPDRLALGCQGCECCRWLWQGDEAGRSGGKVASVYSSAGQLFSWPSSPASSSSHLRSAVLLSVPPSSSESSSRKFITLITLPRCCRQTPDSCSW